MLLLTTFSDLFVFPTRSEFLKECGQLLMVVKHQPKMLGVFTLKDPEFKNYSRS